LKRNEETEFMNPPSARIQVAFLTLASIAVMFFVAVQAGFAA